MAYLPKEQHTPLSLALICLVAAATVGYFMTWQKVFLINKSLAQEAHKNIVINNLQEGVILADHNGKTLTLNQAICQIIGLTREEITTRNPLSPDWNMLMADGITPLPPDLLPTTVAKRTGKTVKNFPIVVKKSDHSIAYLEVTANPISSTHQPDTIEYILITCRDVSELKNAQDIIENQKMQTLANSKLTALGEMAAGIAHEINNPLTIILGRVGTIKRALANQTLDIADIHQGINKIESTTLRISKIVKSMRSLSRENLGGEFTRTGLKSIIDDIITISADNFKHHEITFFTDIQDNIELDCNAGLLSQVFINLINNAVDAIKKQTTSKWIRLEAVYNGNFIKIIFSDSGLGIAPTIKDKIMLPFFTTKEAGKGTGIGLSLSRTIVENHHGRFYIDDKATNTSFIIELPIDQAKNIVVNSAS